MSKQLFLLLGIALFFSCKKKELPVPKHAEGSITKVIIPLTSNYKYQIYFSLGNNAIVQQQLKTSWDIAFQCNGKNIVLNSSKMMFAYKTNDANINESSDTTGFQQNKKYDSPTGNMDSTAIGNWWSNNTTYIIDRGYNESGQHLGWKKIKIISYNNNIFTFSIADISATSSQTYQAVQDTSYNFIGFSFNDNQMKYIEPPKNQWDIVFTSYTEKLSGPYLVTGCLLNRYKTDATIDKTTPFENINYNKAIAYNLSKNINIIGYNWKEYDFNLSSYTVFSNYVYIIRNSKNYYFKLRFIDFYSNSGEKGYPTFEYMLL